MGRAGCVVSWVWCGWVRPEAKARERDLGRWGGEMCCRLYYSTAVGYFCSIGGVVVSGLQTQGERGGG